MQICTATTYFFVSQSLPRFVPNLLPFGHQPSRLITTPQIRQYIEQYGRLPSKGLLYQHTSDNGQLLPLY
jgi:hypothetical protein